VVGVTALAGLLQVGSGAWLFFAPRSFYDVVATFPPYSVHFLHDAGAFLIGIGAMLLAALVWRRDALFVVLLGTTLAAVFHWGSHLLDRDRGGSASDPWTLGAFGLLLLVALVLRFPRREGAR
jgi:hypothetical protein